jgi:hypothetical protein
MLLSPGVMAHEERLVGDACPALQWRQLEGGMATQQPGESAPDERLVIELITKQHNAILVGQGRKDAMLGIFQLRLEMVARYSDQHDADAFYLVEPHVPAGVRRVAQRTLGADHLLPGDDALLTPFLGSGRRITPTPTMLGSLRARLGRLFGR